MRFCPNCGTEVDETVLFCPTCGQAIDQAADVALPPAPAWPEPDPVQAPAPAVTAALDPDPVQESEHEPSVMDWLGPEPEPVADVVLPSTARSRAAAAAWDDAAAAAAPAPPAPPPTMPPPAPVEPAEPAEEKATSGPVANVPLTLPVTLSGWLIGAGSLVGAIGALIGLVDGSASLVGLVVLVGLLAISATVFFASVLPAVPHLRLATLVVALIGFGAAFDRIGFAGAGIGALLLFLGTAAAAIGAILLELGRDEPLGRT